MTQVAPQAKTFEETHIPEKTEFERLLDRDFKPETQTERFLLNRDMYWWQAERFAASGMYRKKFANVELLFAAMMYGLRFGWHPITSLDNLYPVNDKMTPSTQSMLGLAQAAKGGLSMTINETEGRCEVAMTRGSNGETFEVTWTFEDATRAGLTGKDNWKKYQKAMLRWRAIADVLRVLFADILSGVVSTEEALNGDIDAEPPANRRLEEARAAQQAAPVEIPPPPRPANVPSPHPGALLGAAAPGSSTSTQAPPTGPVEPPAGGEPTTPPALLSTAAAASPGGADNGGAAVVDPAAPSTRPLPRKFCTACGAHVDKSGLCPNRCPVAQDGGTPVKPKARTNNPGKADTAPVPAPPRAAHEDPNNPFHHWFAMSAPEVRATWEGMEKEKATAAWQAMPPETKALLRFKLKEAGQ